MIMEEQMEDISFKRNVNVWREIMALFHIKI